MIAEEATKGIEAIEGLREISRLDNGTVIARTEKFEEVKREVKAHFERIREIADHLADEEGYPFIEAIVVEEMDRE